MKHFWMRAVCFALCAVLLTSCAALNPDSESSGSSADPLTGQELLEPGQRPVAITVENESDSLIRGISDASLVLEALTENSKAPSLCFVYPSVNRVPQVGPVTAGQDLYWRLLVGQQVLPVQRGGGQFDQNYLDYYSIRAVDALEVGTNAFSCSSTWNNSPAWYTSGTAISSVLKSLNISSALTESRLTETASSESDPEDTVLTIPSFLPQKVDGKLPDASTADAVQVDLNFSGLSSTGFTYDSDSQTYKMLRSNGTALKDANNGKQASFDNLLILFSASSLRDDGMTFDYDLSMGGGVWLNGGHLWRVTWTQGSDTTFCFYDDDGRPLKLCAGRSYVALVSSLTGQELSVTNSNGDSLLG